MHLARLNRQQIDNLIWLNSKAIQNSLIPLNNHALYDDLLIMDRQTQLYL